MGEYSTRIYEAIKYMKFTLSLPVSVNQMYKRGRGNSFYKSQKAKDWTLEAMYQIMKQKRGQARLKEGNYSLDVRVYIADKRRHDLDNMLKQICDVLVEKQIIKDDSLITEIHIYKDEPLMGKSFIEVEVL